jgi:hypothetical protein
MDHSEAIDGKFTERYLLDELTPAQRDQFEDHYFDCVICADDVQSSAVFVDSARALLREGPGSEETASLGKSASALYENRSGFARYGVPFQSAAFAFVALLCVVGYENVVTIPNLKAPSSDSRTTGIRTPEILPTVSLLGMGARAATTPVAAPLAKDFVFEMEIPGGPEFTGYTCEIRDHSQTVKYTVPITQEQAKDTIRLAIPASALSAGSYKLALLGEKTGAAPQQLVQYSIQIH